MTLKHNGVATTQAVEHVELPIGNTNNPLRKEFHLTPIININLVKPWK